MSGTGSLRALSQELKSLKDEPLEGFRVRLINDSNMFDWEVAIFGPPQTIYEGGYFKVINCLVNYGVFCGNIINVCHFGIG